MLQHRSSNFRTGLHYTGSLREQLNHSLDICLRVGYMELQLKLRSRHEFEHTGLVDRIDLPLCRSVG